MTTVAFSPARAVAAGDASAAAAMLAKAKALRASGDLEGALEACGRIAGGHPGHADAACLCALVRLDQGKVDEAAAALAGIDMAGAGDAELCLALGEALAKAKRPGDAEAAFRRAIASRPDFAEAHYKYGVMLQDAGREEDAAAAFRKALALDSGHAWAHARLGYALKRFGRLEEAAGALERAFAAAPDDYYILNGLTITLHALGRIEEARRHGQRALELKDEAARAFFAKSPFKDLRLNRVSKPFRAEDARRNVISFSLWGDNPVYTEGAIINAQLAPRIYGDWVCRFYCDESVPARVTDRLLELKAQVVFVDDALKRFHGSLWRFFASDDPAVDRFLCRDCDALLNTQERVAVDDWIASGKLFHVMRDHIYHVEVILGGMWGGVAGALPNLRQALTGRWMFDHGLWSDQYFLWGFVWPLIGDDVLVHDSQYTLGNSIDFPKYGRLPKHEHVGGAAMKVGGRAPG
jgi:tetratricopeptide (TPR) repeat protein